MNAQVTVSLVTPRVPRFIRIAGTIGHVRVDQLTERQLNDLAAAWKERLHEAAHFYRTNGREEKHEDT